MAIAVELPLRIPKPREGVEQYLDKEGKKYISGPNGETLYADGVWRKGGKFCANPWQNLAEEEYVLNLYHVRESGTALSEAEMRRLEAFLYGPREAHYNRIRATQDITVLPYHGGWDVNWDPFLKVGESVIAMGLSYGGSAVIAEDASAYATIYVAPHCGGYGMSHDIGKLRKGGGKRWHEPRSIIPTRENYLKFLPFQQSHNHGFTHFVPTEEALPMFDDAEATLAWCNQQLAEVDPRLSVGALVPGWMRQADKYSPLIPRRKYLPGLDGLLYVGTLEGEQRMVYYDDLAWELGVKLEGGGGLTASIYLTQDRRFICSSTCQVEIANTANHQPLTGKVNKYTLQSWMVSAGMEKIRDGQGNMARLDTARPIRIAQVAPRKVNMRLLEHKLLLITLAAQATTQPLEKENKKSQNRLEFFAMPEREEVFARWYLNNNPVRIYRFNHLGTPQATLDWSMNHDTPDAVVGGSVVVGPDEEAALRAILVEVRQTPWRDEVIQDEDEEDYDEDDEAIYDEDDDRGHL